MSPVSKTRTITFVLRLPPINNVGFTVDSCSPDKQRYSSEKLGIPKTQRTG